MVIISIFVVLKYLTHISSSCVWDEKTKINHESYLFFLCKTLIMSDYDLHSCSLIRRVICKLFHPSSFSQLKLWLAIIVKLKSIDNNKNYQLVIRRIIEIIIIIFMRLYLLRINVKAVHMKVSIDCLIVYVCIFVCMPSRNHISDMP